MICTQDRPGELRRCLEGVARLVPAAAETVIVDSAPRHAPAAQLAREFGARYLNEPEPGLSRARNAGARAASAEFVAYLDDDAFAAADWLARLRPGFDDPEVAVVTGGIRAPHDGGGDDEGARLGGIQPAAAGRVVVGRDTPGWFIATHFGALGNGSNMALRRSVFREWDGFNQDLGRGGRVVPAVEEHYAFFELVERGYRVVYEPAAIVFHPVPADAAALERRTVASLRESGMYLAYVWEKLPRYRPELVKLGLGYAGKVLGLRKGMPRELSRAGISRRQQLAAVLAGLSAYRQQQRVAGSPTAAPR